MTTRELQRSPADATCVARVRATAAGEIEIEQGDADDSAYGTVEITWYPDRLTMTALGAGPTSMTETCVGGRGQDITVEIRLPSLNELAETVPGAD